LGYTVGPERRLVEVGPVEPEFLDKIHEFIRLNFFAPLGKVEILTNGDGKPRTGYYSAYFTPEQAGAFVTWLNENGVTPGI